MRRSEAIHPDTRDLDILLPEALVPLFAARDEEALRGLTDAGLLKEARGLLTAWQGERPRRIVLAGAGTSGRLACLLAREHGALLLARGIELVAWIAGGARAQLLPVEGAEDDSLSAREALGGLLRGERDCFVGISCGLSAPCVAAGIAAAREKDASIVVFGVNEAEDARADAFPGLPLGFLGELSAARARGRCHCLTPALGPEALAGSSRMKGGTATYLLFDVLFTMLAEGALADDLELRLCRAFDEARVRDAKLVADAICDAGDTLRDRGRVFYLGRAVEGAAAVLDASECPPTFGADPMQVRAYTEEGWAGLLSEEQDSAGLEAQYPLRLDGFASHAQPCSRDLLFVLGGVGSGRFGEGLRVRELPIRGLLSSKLHLNAISTGAFARAGKIYQNRMIDLRLSNSKLWERALRLVQDLCGLGDRDALRAMLSALYKVDAPGEGLFDMELARHLEHDRPGIVPLAILRAKGLGISEAERAVAKEPVLRELLRSKLGSS